MPWQLLILGLVEHVSEATLAAVLTVEMGSHEDPSTTLLSWTLTSQTVNLPIVINLVILKNSQLNLAVLLLDLLGSCVILLLALLSASPEPENQMQGGLFLNIIVGQGAAIFQLLASKDQPLLVWWDALLVLDLCLNILN